MEKHSQLGPALDLLYRQGLTAAYCWVVGPMEQPSSAADRAGVGRCSRSRQPLPC